MILLKILGIIFLLILAMVVTFVAFVSLLAYIGEKFAADGDKAAEEIAKWRDGE